MLLEEVSSTVQVLDGSGTSVLRVLWMQQKVREKFLSVGPVSTKQNPSDLGTKKG